MAMTTSEPHPKARSRPTGTLSCSMWFLFFVITVAALSSSTLVQADQIYASSKPTLVLYFPAQATITVLNPAQNGIIPPVVSAVFSNTAHETEDPKSPVVGEILGQLVVQSGTGLEYTAFTNVLKTPKYTGTIEVQGSVNKAGYGELAITGGSGDFRKANGYVKFESNVDNVHFRSSFFISYG